MSDNDDKLHKLLQLKNYETPGDEYFDNFLDDFKKQQKLAASKQTKSDLVKERFSMWLEDLGPSKWAVPAGSMAALALTVFVWGNRDRPIVDSKPPLNQLDPSKSETQIIELQLPKPESAPIPKPGVSKPDSVLPVQY